MPQRPPDAPTLSSLTGGGGPPAGPNVELEDLPPGLTPITEESAPPGMLRPARDTDYRDLAKQIATEQGIPTNLFTRLVEQESAWNPGATSPRGARGLTQLMPATAQELGVMDPDDPVENLTGGAKYFKKLLERYEGDTQKALAAYNAGMGNVDRYGGVPPFPETRQYVQKILGLPQAGGAPGPQTLPLKVALKRAVQYQPPPVPSPEGLGESFPLPGTPGSSQASAVSALGQSFKDVLPASGAMLGAAKGGQLAAKVPGPPALKAAAGVAGVVGGAFLGGGAGELAQTGVEQAGGADLSSGEVVARAQDAGTAGVVGELAGRGVGGVLAKAGGFLRQGLSKDIAPAAKAALTKFRESYTTILGKTKTAPLATPGQVSDNQLVDWVEAIARNAPFKSKAIDALDTTQREHVETYLRSVVDKFGVPQTPEAVGRMLQGAREAGEKQALKPFNKVYEVLDRKTTASKVNLMPVLDTLRSHPEARRGFFAKVEQGAPGTLARLESRVAQEMISGQSAATRKLGGATKTVPTVDGVEEIPDVQVALKAMEELVGEVGDDMTITAPQARQLLIKLREQFPAKGSARKAAVDIYSRLRTQLEDVYDDVGVKPQFLQAQAGYKATKDRFANDFVMGELKKSPSRTVKRIMGKVGSEAAMTPEEIRQLRAVSSPQVWRAVQRSTMAKLLSPAPGKPFSAQRVLTQLEKEPEWFKEMVPNVRERRGVQLALERVKVLQGGSRPAGGSGKLWIQFQTAGAIGSIIGGVAAGKPTEGLAGGGAILLTPRVLGRILASPGGRRMLIEGIGVPAGAKGGRPDGPLLRFSAHLTSQWLNEQAREAGQGGDPNGPPPDQESLKSDQELIRQLDQEDQALESDESLMKRFGLSLEGPPSAPAQRTGAGSTPPSSPPPSR